MKKNKRGALEFSFTWIFAIIAGIFIIFLAIYGVSKFMNIERNTLDAKTAMDIGVLTNPLESSFESAKRTLIVAPSETRVYTECDNESGSLGKQIISTSQNSYNKWSTKGVGVSFPNKYIFSANPAEGKSFYIFSKSFDFPFKITDLIYLTSTKDKYCFVNTPKDIEDEIEDLTGNDLSGSENFFTKTADCPEESIRVCFSGGANCDITVTGDYVKKDGKTMYYSGINSLMYAAIFSDKDSYECQLDRIMKRASQLSEIYSEKSLFVFQKTGCNSGLDAELATLRITLDGFESSEDLGAIIGITEDLEIANKMNSGDCRLW